MNLTSAFMYAIAPAANALIVAGIVNNAALMADMSDAEVCCFLGQSAQETGGFTVLEENLNYSAPRLRAVWPSRFPSVDAAAPYAHNPRALADLVYGDRMGNRPGTDDGYNFRGRGMFNTTGRENYAKVGPDAVATPSLLTTFPLALKSALVYWTENNLARFVAGNDIAGLTKAIQGGNEGLDSRKLYTSRGLAALGKLPKTNAAVSYTHVGMSGDTVEALQSKLTKLGYVLGKVDGNFGPATQAAVKHFQADHKINPVDGIVGPVTLTAIEKELPK